MIDNSSSQSYKIGFKEIQDKIFELEQLMDESRFTKIELKLQSGYKVSITHKERDDIFMKTGKIRKFLPVKPKGD